MATNMIGKVRRDGAKDPVEVKQHHDFGGIEITIWQNTSLILMTPEQAAHLSTLLQDAIEQEHARAVDPPAPEPLRRFPLLYERLQAHDAKNGDTWPKHRYAIEVGTGAKHTEGRAYVRIDGDEADSTAVFLWDEGRRRFDFRGNTNLYLIPVDHFEGD